MLWLIATINVVDFSVRCVATINLVVCDTTERVTTLLEHKSETPDLKIIVCFEPFTSELRQLAADANVEIITFDDLEVGILIEHLFQ